MLIFKCMETMETPEIFYQIYPSNNKKDAELDNPETVEQIEERFENRWAKYRKARNIVINPDGTQTEHAIYQIELPKTKTGEAAKHIVVDFTQAAMILGFHSTLASLALPDNPGVLSANWNEPTVFFFLSRINPQRTQGTNPITLSHQ